MIANWLWLTYLPKMQRIFRSFTNIFAAITLVAFIVAAIPTSVMASTSDMDSSIVHIIDGKKDAAEHQKDGQCDDGCCISHCFCAGFAVPITQTVSMPLVYALAVIIGENQKAEGALTSPQLRPPRILV